MLLSRNEALAKAFKEETQKGTAPKETPKSEIKWAEETRNYTQGADKIPDPVVEAVRVLRDAIREYQAGIKKGLGRKTKDNAHWKRVVAKSLGLKRLTNKRWEEVCEKAIEYKMLEVFVQEESQREYWVVLEPTKSPLEEFLNQGREEHPKVSSDTLDEEISAIEVEEDGTLCWDSEDKKFYPMAYLMKYRILRLEKQALEKEEKGEFNEEGFLIASCPDCGSYKMELYQNSFGKYRCCACNDLHYSQSQEKYREKT